MIGGGRNVEGNRSRTGDNTPSKFISGAAPAKNKPAVKAKAKAKLKVSAKAKAKKSKPKSKSAKRK
jgi:hypothetical protein